jgi:hypothetical protein
LLRVEVVVAESWKRFEGGPGLREPSCGNAPFDFGTFVGTKTFSRRMTGFFAPPRLKLFMVVVCPLQAFIECR